MNNDAMQLRLSDVLHAILKNRMLILALTLVGLGVGIVLSIVSYTRGEISKEYAVTTSIAVTSVTEDGLFTTKSSNPGSSDVHLAEDMVDAVIYVLKSDRLLGRAIDRMGLIGISISDITSHLSLKQYNETQIIEMTLFWRSAEEGVQILNAINQAAPQVLIQTLKIGGVSVVNSPTARYRVGGSVDANVWVYMAALGMMMGIGVSLLRLLISPTLVNTKDMERNLGVTVLGEIPENKKYFSRKRSILVNEADGVGDDVNESFASTSHILQHMLSKDGSEIMYVTSTTQNEGKTSVAANLAVHLSDMEKKVLLIDFDVRNPSLGTVFLEKVDYVHSINALYRGDTTMDEAITTLTGYLDLMPAILERTELPLDDAMMDLVKNLAEKYDYVLMDTAPIGRVADPMSLNRITKNALFVVRYDSTGLNEIRDSLEKLDKSGVKVVGCIVNGIRKMGKNDSYGYGYGYGRSYGRKNKKSAPKSEIATEAVPPVETKES